MPRKVKPDPLVLGDDVACVLTEADTRHWMLLNDEETAAMADGTITPSLQERARSLLSYREAAQDGDVFVKLSPPK